LRYGFFEYPVDFIVGGHAFLSTARPPLIDIVFTLGLSLDAYVSGVRAFITEGGSISDVTVQRLPGTGHDFTVGIGEHLTWCPRLLHVRSRPT
jgi:hypothetical protein